MNTSKKLPFWLRRVDTLVSGQPAATSKVVLDGPAIATVIGALAIGSVALVAISHYVQRTHTIQAEIKTAHVQCTQLFANAAKVIGDRHHVDLSVGSVSIERFMDRDNGPDTLDCRANVKAGPVADQWIATGHPGEPFMLVSARLASAEMVDEFPQQLYFGKDNEQQ